MCLALDGWSPSVLHYVYSEVSGLINACFEVGHFPNFFKVARVTPVFKDGHPSQLGNYQPISVLSVVSKIFERAIQERLLSFLKMQGSLLNSMVSNAVIPPTRLYLT
jgi:hypothetical protein